MSEQDTLTLGARIKDEFSGPVREMTKGWNAFSDRLKHGHEEGVKHAKLHKKEIEGLSEKFDEMRRGILEGLTPALEELGLGFFSVGGSLAGVVATLKSSAEAFNVFKDASRRAGTSVDFLQSMSATLSNLTGESATQATQNLADLNEQLQRITRERPDTVNAWRSAYSGLWETLGQDLKGKTAPQAMETFMKWKEAHPEIAIDKVRDILQLLHLDQRLATVSLKEYREEEERQALFQKEHPYDPEVAKRLDQSFNHLRDTIRGVGQDITNTFGAQGVSLVDWFSTRIGNLSKEVIALDQAALAATGHATPGSPFLPLYGTNEAYASGDADYGPTGLSGLGKLGPRTLADIWRSWATPNVHAPTNNAWERPLFWKPPTDAEDLAGGMRPISFTTGGSSSEGENVFTRSIHSGTLAALQDWYGALSGKHDGIVPASYGPSGSGGSGHWGGGGYSVLEGGGAHPAPGGAGNTAGGGGRGRGVPSGSGPAPGGVSGNARETAKIVADEWARAGMSREGIAGLMANIKDESNFDPALRHPDQPKFGGEAHFAHGLYQEGGTEWNHYKAWLDQNYPGEDWRDPRLQSRFAAENLKKNYPGTWSKMLHGDRFHAAAAYVGEYLKPAEQYRQGRMSKYLGGGVGELERYTGPRDLLSQPAAPAMGGGTHKVEGDAHLKVDLNGFPKGTRTDLTFGGLFTQYTLNRGRQMPDAGDLNERN